MKIGSSLDTIATTDLAARSPVRSAGTHAATSVVDTDKVALSAAATQIGAGDGEFDSAKVDAIRQAIREGRFNVNPDAIADRLLADAAALLGPRAA